MIRENETNWNYQRFLLDLCKTQTYMDLDLVCLKGWVGRTNFVRSIAHTVIYSNFCQQPCLSLESHSDITLCKYGTTFQDPEIRNVWSCPVIFSTLGLKSPSKDVMCEKTVIFLDKRIEAFSSIKSV